MVDLRLEQHPLMAYPFLQIRDFERAHLYALDRLSHELSPQLTYHSLVHTRDEVLPAVERLAALEGVTGEPLQLMRTAACFHDIGFVQQPQDHEAVGAQLAAEVLPHFGYTATQVSLIVGMILATSIPQQPRTLLEAIVADADLDVLGRCDFWKRNQALHAEVAALGMDFTDAQWYTHQLQFLRNHMYFTNAARILRGGGKRRHIVEMERRLAACLH